MRGVGGGGGARQRGPRKVSAISPYNPATAASAGTLDIIPGGRRDSDASMCSSRPSSAGGRPLQSALLSDRSAQSVALHSINAYLSSHSAGISLKPPLPSARDITACIRFLLSRLDFDLGPNLDDDLVAVLKYLGCPVKLNRSALRAPGTPHAWPPLLSVLYWLVQLARYADHQLSSSPLRRPTNDVLLYTAQSYTLYISGEDEAVTELDEEYLREMEHGAANAAASVDALAKEVAELEEKVNGMKSGLSRKEELERERNMLVEDSRKFQSVVESFKEKVAEMEGKLRDREKELEAKERESKGICKENVELQRRIEGQVVNARDVERMRRELQAVERDIGEAEQGRNAMEEKAWELEVEIGKKLKELEAMVEQCNQAMRK